MKKIKFDYLKNASISELKQIINAIRENPKVVALDITMSDVLLNDLFYFIKEQLIEHLYNHHENTVDFNQFNEISISFLNKIRNNDIKFFEAYFEDESNFYNYNRWLFSYSSEGSFAEWAEFNFEKFFEDNFHIQDFI
jgi:hypothetical protein